MRAVVRVEGELDMATAPTLARALERVGTASREVVIELNRVSFLDVVALGELLRAQRRLEANGRRLALAGDSPAFCVNSRTFTRFGSTARTPALA